MFKRAREKIFEEYIGNNKEKLFRISYAYLKDKDDAMDIIHESIVKAYNKLGSIKIGNFKFKGISSEK